MTKLICLHTQIGFFFLNVYVSLTNTCVQRYEMSLSVYVMNKLHIYFSLSKYFFKIRQFKLWKYAIYVELLDFVGFSF